MGSSSRRWRGAWAAQHLISTQAKEDKARYDAALKAAGVLTKAEKKAQGPKRPLSAYMHFCAERRPSLTEELKAQLGAEFDPNHFEYVARWDPDNEWIDMGLRSRWAQTVHVAELGLDVWFEKGEIMRNEVSSKFDTATFTDELAAVGLEVVAWYHDPDRDFGVSLSVVR